MTLLIGKLLDDMRKLKFVNTYSTLWTLFPLLAFDMSEEDNVKEYTILFHWICFGLSVSLGHDKRPTAI